MQLINYANATYMSVDKKDYMGEDKFDVLIHFVNKEVLRITVNSQEEVDNMINLFNIQAFGYDNLVHMNNDANGHGELVDSFTANVMKTMFGV